MGTISFLVSLFSLTILEEQCKDCLSQHRLASEHNATVATSVEWPFPFIMIVNTRFMQQQANLIDLARARLILFETFCLNSMLSQTILTKHEEHPFLWIIKTDPDLDESILKKLISLIEPYPFIYLVASNVNYGIGVTPGGWRGSQAGQDVLQSQVYSGNMTLLRQAHAARETRAVLETRLDADDGLHVQWLELIEAEAYERLRYKPDQSGRQDWMYWCAVNHLDWSPAPPFVTNASEYGTFVPYKTSKGCITAGLTVAVSVGQDEDSIPRFMHHELYHELSEETSCGSSDTCLHMMTKPVLGAIRSRTATSAGMRNVKIMNEDTKKHAQVPMRLLVTALQQGFHVTIADVIQVNQYMQDHVFEIAADNLRGQCTHGHSCKNETRKALDSILRQAKKRKSRGRH